MPLPMAVVIVFLTFFTALMAGMMYLFGPENDNGWRVGADVSPSSWDSIRQGWPSRLRGIYRPERSQ